MDAKHTPGEWKVEADFIDDDESPDYLRITAPGADVASGILIDADARLIAAAPELLEAAQLVIAWFEAEEDHSKADFYKRMDMCRESEIAIRAAIAKAKGA